MLATGLVWLWGKGFLFYAYSDCFYACGFFSYAYSSLFIHTVSFCMLMVPFLCKGFPFYAVLWGEGNRL